MALVAHPRASVLLRLDALFLILCKTALWFLYALKAIYVVSTVVSRCLDISDMTRWMLLENMLRCGSSLTPERLEVFQSGTFLSRHS